MIFRNKKIKIQKIYIYFVSIYFTTIQMNSLFIIIQIGKYLGQISKARHIEVGYLVRISIGQKILFRTVEQHG